MTNIFYKTTSLERYCGNTGRHIDASMYVDNTLSINIIKNIIYSVL